MITNKNFIVLIACLFVSSNDLLALGADTPQSGSRPTDVRDSKSGTPGNSAGVPPGFKPGEQEAIAAHDQSLKTKNDTSDLSAEAPPVATPTSLDVSDINTTEVKNDNVNDSSVEQPAVENKPALDSKASSTVSLDPEKNGSVNGGTPGKSETLTITDTTDAQTSAVNPVHPGTEGVDLSGLDSQPAVKSAPSISSIKPHVNGITVNLSDGSVVYSSSDPNKVIQYKNGSMNEIPVDSLSPDLRQAFKSSQQAPLESKATDNSTQQSAPLVENASSGQLEENPVVQAPSRQSFSTRVANQFNAISGRTVDVTNIKPDETTGVITVGKQTYTPVKNVYENTASSSGIITGTGDNRQVFADKSGNLYLKDGNQLVYKSNYTVRVDTSTPKEQAVIQEGPNGVPHVTEEEFKNQYSQLTQELQNQLEVTSGKLQRNKTTGQFYDATFADVNARIDLINNLPNNTRATIQNELATINTSESTIGSIKRTAGSLKKAVVGSKAPIVTSSQKSAGRLVQSAIDNLTGKDTLSGESIYSLPQEVQTKLINDVAARLNEKGLFDSRNQGNDALRAQIITNAINDLIMPKILPDDVKMSSAIASDGTYSSTVTKGNRIITSKVDNKGNMTERTMSTTDPTSNEKTTFKTTYNSSQGLLGSAKTVMTKTNASGNVTTTQDVSDSDGKLISAVTDYCTSMTMTDVAVGFTKVGVIGAKQVIINGVSTLVSIPIATTVGVAGLVAVKAGSMLSGADFSKPVIKAAVNLGFDLAGGGERVVGFSANKGQLFTSGGVGNKTANFVQGKGFTASAVDPNEKIYNPIGESVNGLVSAVAGKIAPVWSGKQMFSNPTPVSQAAAVAG